MGLCVSYNMIRLKVRLEGKKTVTEKKNITGSNERQTRFVSLLAVFRRRK